MTVSDDLIGESRSRLLDLSDGVRKDVERWSGRQEEKSVGVNEEEFLRR